MPTINSSTDNSNKTSARLVTNYSNCPTQVRISGCFSLYHLTLLLVQITSLRLQHTGQRSWLQLENVVIELPSSYCAEIWSDTDQKENSRAIGHVSILLYQAFRILGIGLSPSPQ